MSTSSPAPLKLLPVYLGVSTLNEALEHPRVNRILWLEILVNDTIDWTALSHPFILPAYQMACRWYTRYHRLVSSLIPRTPLPEDRGAVDERLYRRFAEALEFAHAHP